MKSGNLNFLEPSGPLQACNGTALLFMCKTLRKETDWMTEYCRIILKQVVRKYFVLEFSVFRRVRT
jgi:hypothetical protein